MAYRVKKYKLGTVIETEIRYAGKNGRKGEKRAPKKKITPEQMKKQNKWKKVQHLRRLLLLNFEQYDYFCTLKYPRGTRMGIEEVQKDMRRFIARLRAPYERAGTQLKYLFRIEIGRRGGIHIHLIIKRLPKDGDKLIQSKWKAGRVNFQHLYEQGGYADLAEYMAKDLPEDIDGQLNLFDDSEKKKLCSYHPSRNLEKPVPEIKEYKRRTVEKILREGPVPEKGYCIDKKSIRQGINPYTGYSYLYYSETKAGQVPWKSHKEVEK